MNFNCIYIICILGKESFIFSIRSSSEISHYATRLKKNHKRKYYYNPDHRLSPTLCTLEATMLNYFSSRFSLLRKTILLLFKRSYQTLVSYQIVEIWEICIITVELKLITLKNGQKRNNNNKKKIEGEMK